MAYTNETTHFGIPLPLGSDLTTPMDYNESMQDVDTALFEAQTDSGSALQKANQLQLDLSTTNDNVTAVTGRVTTLEGTTTTQGQAIIQNTQDIADVRADALDMITAKDEGTAQVATVAVSKGQYFRYNDVLYLATENIAIGDTIVPNENCTATNVGTELTQLISDLFEKKVTESSSTGTYGDKIAEIAAVFSTLPGGKKNRAFLKVANNKYLLNNFTGVFISTSIATNDFRHTMINLTNSTIKEAVSNINGTIAINDLTATADSVKFELWC